MSTTLSAQGNECCSPCPSPVVSQVPGPTGPAGAAGTNGTNGHNAFTTLTAQFTQPFNGSNVNISVADTSWMAIGQTIFISTGGYYTVAVIVSAVAATITFPAQFSDVNR